MTPTPPQPPQRPQPPPDAAATPFPVFLDLAGRKVLVVGGGEAAVAAAGLEGPTLVLIGQVLALAHEEEVAERDAA